MINKKGYAVAGLFVFALLSGCARHNSDIELHQEFVCQYWKKIQASHQDSVETLRQVYKQNRSRDFYCDCHSIDNKFFVS